MKHIAATAALLPALAGAAAPGAMLEWPHVGAEQTHTKYSLADEVTPGNVGEREIALQWAPNETPLEEYGTRPGRLPARRHHLREGRGRRTHLPQQPRPPVRHRRPDRRAGRGLRRARERSADRGAWPSGDPPRVRPDLPAGGVRGPGDRGEPGTRPGPAPVRPTRNRAGVRRPHGQAPLGLLYRPPVRRRFRRGHLGRRVVALHRARQRVGTHVARPRARPAVRADEHAEQRLLGRPPSRCEPLRRHAGVSRCAHRQAAVALPGGAPRRVGLRLRRTAQPGDDHGGRS